MSKFTIFFLISLLSVSIYSQEESGQDRGKVREAAQSGLSENGISKPQKGEKLKEEDRLKMQVCMKGKGFDKFKGPRRRN